MLRRESVRPKNGAVTCRAEAPEEGEAGLHTHTVGKGLLSTR